MKIKVKESPGLVRESSSQAILNVDSEALNKYRQDREEKQRLKTIIKEHDELKKDVEEIKAMIKELLNR